MGRLQSDIDQQCVLEDSELPCYRQHRYRGGPPPRRIVKMQLSHEARARKAGVCGICHRPVAFAEFTVDHIIPLSRGGPHLLHNLQPAHALCNVKKGQTL